LDTISSQPAVGCRCPCIRVRDESDRSAGQSRTRRNPEVPSLRRVNPSHPCSRVRTFTCATGQRCRLGERSPNGHAPGCRHHLCSVPVRSSRRTSVLVAHRRGSGSRVPVFGEQVHGFVGVDVTALGRLAEVVLRGGRSRRSAGRRLVLWPGPKKPHSVVAVSGGRGGSPVAVPEPWSVARVCGWRSETATA
jgi:hypothetical protein